MKTFQVMAHNVEKIRGALSKLVRKAAKHGLPSVSFSISKEPTGVRIVDIGERVIKVAAHDVTVSGPAPRIQGWDLVAILDHFLGGTVIRAVDTSAEIPEIYRTRVTCDHCETNRKRNDTFLLRNAEGTLMQVGRQCLKDFTGHEAPEMLVCLYRDLLVMEAGAFGGGESIPRSAYGMSIEEFLACASAVARDHGYVTRNQAMRDGGWTTGQRVWRGEGNDSESDWATARAALNWLDTQPEDSDFMYNIKTVARNGIVTEKLIGFAAAILGCYLREKETRRAPPQGHVGAVGETVEARVKVLSARYLDKEFPSYLIKMADPAGNMFTWFATPGTAGTKAVLNADGELSIKGKVKNHSEFKGQKETILSHVAVM